MMMKRQRQDPHHAIQLVDVLVGGDIHRIVFGGIPLPTGHNARDTRAYFRTQVDALRHWLLSYPYGHQDMCVDFILPSTLPEASYGYIILEGMGYPYFSGSNTVAVATALLSYGLIPAHEGVQSVCLEAPAGPVSADVEIEASAVRSVCIDGGVAYVMQRDQTVQVPDWGEVRYDLVWSGHYYVMLRGRDWDLEVQLSEMARMKALCYAVQEAIQAEFDLEHPEMGQIEAPSFVHLMGPAQRDAEGHYEARGVTYGHPNTIWNCPTGTGTAARMALMHERGELELGQSLNNFSAAGNPFLGTALELVPVQKYTGLRTRIRAQPFIIGETALHLSAEMPMVPDAVKDFLLG